MNQYDTSTTNPATAVLPALPRIFYTLCLVCLVSLFTAPSLPAQETSDTAAPAVSATDEAGTIVRELHDKLIYIMQNAETLGYQGRYEQMQDVVSRHFDTPLIAKVIMSRYWKELDQAQKSGFIELFRKLSIATYASRFDGYSGESFVELETEELKKGRLLIKTELQRPDDKPVKLDYLIHRPQDRWMIISVIANGVNDLSLKRAEYATVIKDRGYDGLVDDVSAKIKDMENDGDGEHQISQAPGR